MKKILTIIGARPQIIKAAAIHRVFRDAYKGRWEEIILHTGQHYDEAMSDVFIRELGMAAPGHHLAVGSGSHGVQTAKMIEGIEAVLLKDRPDAVLVYGDTNSTLAAAVAASKIHIPVVHVEAGLRSFDKTMPEEINRIVCDHVSTLLFSPTEQGITNLRTEGFDTSYSGPFSMDHPGVFHCGDIMLDNALYYSRLVQGNTALASGDPLPADGFLLATVHRDHTTDHPERLASVMRAFLRISALAGKKIILPLHPRTRKNLEHLPAELLAAITSGEHIQLIGPVSFLDMILLESRCTMVLTDSGGVQKEAFFFQKPCVILRPTTEWVELTGNGNALLASTDEEKIVAAYETLSRATNLTWPAYFGDGKAAEFICATIDACFG